MQIHYKSILMEMCSGILQTHCSLNICTGGGSVFDQQLCGGGLEEFAWISAQLFGCKVRRPSHLFKKISLHKLFSYQM